MTQRTVVVLGCSRGIGLGVMKVLSESSSCKALVGVVRKVDDADKLKAQFFACGKVSILCGDVVEFESMQQIATWIEAAGLVPDLLICNAGVLTTPKPFDEISDEDMQVSFNVNVLGAHHAMKAFLPLMRNVPGAVMVNLSSGYGLWGDVSQASYCATKHALEGLVKCAALDTAEDAVSIVTVRPGVVYTEMLEVALGGKEAAKSRGVAVEEFAGQFCEKVFAITKAESGTHIDCGFKRIK